jgi:hypothetical protein
MGALPAPATTSPWQGDTSAIQSMMMVQLQVLAPRPPTGHSLEQQRTPREGQRAHTHAWQATAKQEMAQRKNELTDKQTTAAALPLGLPWCEPTHKAERILMVDFTSTQA